MEITWRLSLDADQDQVDDAVRSLRAHLALARTGEPVVRVEQQDGWLLVIGTVPDPPTS